VSDERIQHYARILGRHRPEVKRLLDVAANSERGAPVVRHVLRRQVVQAGGDPDDPASFTIVWQLPPGLMRIGHVDQGNRLGPLFALPAATRDNVQHIGIFGPTRLGKTRLMLHVARQAMAAGGRVWILDPEDEHAVLLPMLPEARRPVCLRPDDLRVCFFQPPVDSLATNTWLADLTLLARQQMFLRDGSLNLFAAEMKRLMQRKAAADGQFPSLAETRQHFADLKFGSSKVRSSAWLESLVNRLTTLCDTFEQTAHVSSSDMLAHLAERSVVFRLRELRGIPLQFLTDFLIVWLSRYREAAPE